MEAGAWWSFITSRTLRKLCRGAKPCALRSPSNDSLGTQLTHQFSTWPPAKECTVRTPLCQHLAAHGDALSEPLAATRRMQHLYVRTAACPIPRPLLVHYPRKTLGHLQKDQELGHIKDVCPCHCSITGDCPRAPYDALGQCSMHCSIDTASFQLDHAVPDGKHVCLASASTFSCCSQIWALLV